MNRRQRREFNRRNKTDFTKEQFEAMEIYQRLHAGELNIKETAQLSLLNNYIHIDDEKRVPDGTEVKLNYNRIKSRSQKELTAEFKQWVEDHKDDIFHVTRENAGETGLVCLKEDERVMKENYTDDDKNIGHVPWLWDIFADLLYKNEAGEWVELAQIPFDDEETEENA